VFFALRMLHSVAHYAVFVAPYGPRDFSITCGSRDIETPESRVATSVEFDSHMTVVPISLRFREMLHMRDEKLAEESNRLA
jgi:hypothetical protein